MPEDAEHPQVAQDEGGEDVRDSADVTLPSPAGTTNDEARGER
jgi:hypothetical protein